MNISDFLSIEVYGSTLLQWLVAAGITSVILLAYSFAKPIVLRRLTAASQHTPVAIDDAIVAALQSTRFVLVTIVAINIGTRALELSPNVQKLIDGAAAIAFFVQLGLWASALLQFWVDRSQQRAREAGQSASLGAVAFVGRIVLWAIVVLLALDNLGINITTLIAGLGIGGVAVALAVQNILGDLFASLSIVVDKPFVEGDFIIVDNFMGTVEHIGMKTTRVRSLDGEQIIFSNSDLLKGRIKNYKRMRERRVVFKIGLSYKTTPEQLQTVPGIIKRLLERHEQVRFERSHFFRFGDSSLDFETIFWMKTPDYNTYMDVQQDLNLALMRELDQAGIEFAFPTRTLVTEQPLKVEEVGAADGDDGEGGTQPGKNGKDEREGEKADVKDAPARRPEGRH